MKKGDRVIRLLHGAGVVTGETVTVARVSKKKGILWLDDQNAGYDAETLEYLGPSVPGFWYELVEWSNANDWRRCDDTRS